MFTTPSRLPRLASLQGLRALSIIAVLVYHLNPRWLPGGYIGVEIFFVVSGYLITSLLYEEFRKTQRIDISMFWKRRAKRLLPAAYVLIGATLVAALLFSRQDLVQLRGDIWASLLYVQNWQLILAGQSYFTGLGEPSLLQHLWSLAVEEQFYVLWPFVLVLLLKWRWVRQRPRRLVLVFVVCAVLSQIWSAIVASSISTDRAYYGTDTRLTGLLLGAALAFYIRPVHLTSTHLKSTTQRVSISAISILCLAGTIFIAATAPIGTHFFYNGGFLLLGLLTLVLIICGSLQGSMLAWLLAGKWLGWIGDRSYSLYLWHWPIFVLLRQTDLPFAQIVMAQLLLTIVCSELSYRYIEQPMRRTLFPDLRGWRYGPITFVRFSLLTFFVSLSLLFASWPRVVAGTWLPAEYLARRQEIEGQFGAQQSVSISSPQMSENNTPSVAVQPEPATPTAPLRRPDGIVTIIGDSVILGAGQSVINRYGVPVVLNGEVGRSPAKVLEVVQALDGQKQLGQTVVIAIGWNGLLTDKQFADVSAYLGEGRRVFWVTPVGDRPWIGESAALLRKLVPETSGAFLIPWDEYSKSHPEWFAYDGIHIAPEGAEQFAGLLYQATLVR